MFIFPVQLTTSRIGNLTRLIHTLLNVMTIHTYIHNFEVDIDRPKDKCSTATPSGSTKNVAALGDFPVRICEYKWTTKIVPKYQYDLMYTINEIRKVIYSVNSILHLTGVC